MADGPLKIDSDSGSKERVAIELMKHISFHNQNYAKDKDSILNLYAECLIASSGYRQQ